MCPKSIPSEHTQVLELFDGLDFMVVLRHVRGLPLRFSHQHRIVAGRRYNQRCVASYAEGSYGYSSSSSDSSGQGSSSSL